MGRLKNQFAVITGGAAGIGAAAVKLFVKEGAKVLALDIKDTVDMPKDVEYLPMDVSRASHWHNVVSYLNQNSYNPTILVNNAGISGIGLGTQNPEDMSLKTWDLIHQTNATGVFLGCKYLLPLMKNSKGPCSIINVASRSGLVGVPDLSAYASSKASVINYTKSLALYCAYQQYNIRCNYIAPAAILTDMWKEIIKNPTELKKISASIPLKRMGTPEEVAKAILYFASQESDFVTGSGLTIDGGILAGSAASPSDKKSEE